MKTTTKTFVACVSLLFLSYQSASAQSLKDLFNRENVEKAVSTITGKNTNVDLVGKWVYNGSAVEFESDNLLLKAGGAAASKGVETKLNEQLNKFGITPGKMSFTFAADSTFTADVSGKPMKGTYSYDNNENKLNLKFARLINMGADINYTSSSMDLLFDADKLLKLITFLSSKTNNAALSSISTLSSQYDGMQLGFELRKEQ